MTHILKADGREIRKWRAQADAAAKKLKAQPQLAALDVVKVGFVFDDAMATLNLEGAQIRDLGERQLADYIYNMVLAEAQASRPAAGTA